ncbi:hypothetical protein GCM10009113_06630 [Marinobacter szutsaonensis]
MMIAIDHGGFSWGAEPPPTTITTENRHALVVALLAKHYTGVTGADLRVPIGTITTKDRRSLVAAFLTPTTKMARAKRAATYGNRCQPSQPKIDHS